MTIWAIGNVGSPARFIEASDPSVILGYMETGDVCAPVTDEQRTAGGTLVGNMAFAPAVPTGNVTLDTQKLARLAELAVLAAPKLALWQGGNAPTGGLQVDDTSTGRLTSWAAQALVCKMTAATFGLPYWVMADNSHHTFTGPDDFLAFASAAAAYKTAAILNYSALKGQIQAAADATALNAIDITGGWPT